MEHISSLQNPRIKFLQRLEKSSERKQTDQFVTEGFRELKLAVDNHYELVELYVCEEVFYKKHNAKELSQFVSKDPITLSSQVFEKLAYREGSDGLIGLLKAKEHRLQDLSLKEKPLVVVLEQVEKPGNVGAILRTCEAAGVDAVFLADTLTDLYNPNLIRASLGSVFSLKLIVDRSEVIKQWLTDQHFQIFPAIVEAKELYFQSDFKSATAIVMGSEAHGLSGKWRSQEMKPVRIPMRGQVDSLNVANALSILVFEALRQRSISVE
jgi:RNA methyltransferase, TrmH family